MTPDTGLPARMILAVSIAAPFLAAALVCRWVATPLSVGLFAVGAAAFALAFATGALASFRTYFASAAAPLSKLILNAAAVTVYWLVLAPLGVILRGSRARAMWHRAKSSQPSYWKTTAR